MSRYTALIDACVFYSAPLRDILMELAVCDLFHAKWTNDIHDEWIKAVHEDRPDISLEKLMRTRNLEVAREN